MKSTISINNIDLIKNRFKRQAHYYFWRISIPIVLILTISFSLFYNEATLIFPVIVFLLFSSVELLRGFIWIRPHSKQLQKNYSIELKDDLLIERMGKTVTELELTNVSSYINRFGVLMINNKSNLSIKRFLDINYIKIPPEVDNFNELKKQIEEKTCANNGEHS